MMLAMAEGFSSTLNRKWKVRRQTNNDYYLEHA